MMGQGLTCKTMKREGKATWGKDVCMGGGWVPRVCAVDLGPVLLLGDEQRACSCPVSEILSVSAIPSAAFQHTVPEPALVLMLSLSPSPPLWVLHMLVGPFLYLRCLQPELLYHVAPAFPSLPSVPSEKPTSPWMHPTAVKTTTACRAGK